jgi:hypothetical protein
MRAGVVAAIVLAATVAYAQLAGTLRGQVIDRKTRAPVAGAIVAVGGELVATDDAGRFAVTLAHGRYTIEITAAWLAEKKQPIVLNGDLDVELEVDPAEKVAGETIEITDIAVTAPGETRVDARLARIAPTGGDAAKIVQSLAPVARPPAGSSEIVVWGAAPRDTRVFVDGVPVAALYHVGGYRAAVGNDLVSTIRLAPAAFGPDRGRAIGGVIDIGLADPAAVPSWRAQADLLDGGVAGRTTVGGVTIAGAIRRSWLDRAVGLIADPRELAPNAPLPRWTDAQLVARARLRDDVIATGWVLAAIDALDRVLPSDDPATETAQQIDQRTGRAQNTLRRETAQRIDRATLWIGRDRSTDDLRVGLTPASQRLAQWVGGARGVQQSKLGGRASLVLGVDLDAESAQIRRTGSLTIPAREGDLRIFGQPPGDDVAADQWRATTIDAAGHAALDLRAGRFTATLGGRVDAWLLGASRLTPRIGATPGIGSQEIELTGDPRASLQLRLTDEATLRLDGGRYHQARAASDASAVFGTPGLGLEQAWHATVGAQWRRAPVALEAAGYARWLDDLVARDLAVTPLFAEALTQGGTGRVLGVQLTARVVAWAGLSGWLSYGLSRSTRKDTDDQRERLFDRDQTHGLIAVGGWERGRWSIGGRVRLSTGEPRTGVLGSFFDSRSGRFQPIRGAHNGVRLPAYFAADVRAEHRFTLGGARAAVYAELQNLTNRSNAEEIIYSADFSSQAYLTSLPLLAIAGARIER